jgi:Na+/melibiose symporter-like transporter
MQPNQVGSAMAIMGTTGLALQLLLYPKIHARFGPLKCFQVFSLFFPLAYFLSPFLVIIPQNHSGEPGVYTWVAVTIILLIHSTGRIFCIPASIALLNNCSPHPSVLGTINGVGQTISSLFRTIGPACAGYCKPLAILTLNTLL